MKTHVLGFPRMGAQRELKWALESYWNGKRDGAELLTVAQSLKEQNWKTQAEAGLSMVSTGDFSLYDHVLDTTFMLGLIPQRFAEQDMDDTLKLYFQLARGDKSKNLAAMEMTKWFNTNYHFIVPEIDQSSQAKLFSKRIIEDTKQAIELGYPAKAVLLGPITYLSLAKSMDGTEPWSKLDEIVAVYQEVIAELSGLCEWIQIDEPILVMDMQQQARDAFQATYQKLNEASGNAKLLLTTYFEGLTDNADLAVNSGCAGLHMDVSDESYFDIELVKKLSSDMMLSVGVVSGRNIWKTDFSKKLILLHQIADVIGSERVMLASGSSLLHVPVDLRNENKLDADIKEWLAFAVQKCEEVVTLEKIFADEAPDALESNRKVIASRLNSTKVNLPAVQNRAAGITETMMKRNTAYAQRKQAQSWLKLPLLPTTSIGSFPQTPEIRKTRRAFKKGEVNAAQYEQFIENEIRQVIQIQEEIGLDVLVHGEPERNDMVEYFGEQLDGFCFTANGWVQSYGSRCVKPPIIFGDVYRPHAMTVKESQYAQSITDKIVKGMLTGPVTILCWSFVRDDMPREQVCRQIGLAIRDEVQDLEAAGIRVIQIDEPAFREGVPLKSADREAYLNWAVACFRLSTCGVKDETQIHTHMCYSEFNDVMPSIAAMDADVISIESSRSKMELLDAFSDFAYPNEIGPGVYDIHSPRIPGVDEMVELIEKALEKIPAERLWVNPDCGLKTRKWEEARPSLENMVKAKVIVKQTL